MTLLPLVFICPLLGALLLAFLRGMPERLAALIGVGSMALSALSAAFVAVTYLSTLNL